MPEILDPLPSEPDEPFWRRKRLHEMTAVEWEGLCDGCARCCLMKLEDEDTGAFYFTDVSCNLLDSDVCRCREYPDRQAKMPDCVRLTPKVVPELPWLPATCAYRLVAEGEDLPWWHPLVSGNPDTVHQAGISVRDRVAGPEGLFTIEQLLDRVVEWPNEQGPRRPASPESTEP